MNPERYWIPGPWRGKLAIETRPRGGDWLEDEASGWRRAGLNLIVSLLEEAEAAHLQLARKKDAAMSPIAAHQHPRRICLRLSNGSPKRSRTVGTLQSIAAKGLAAQG